MEFFDRKEEVLDVQLTQYGKYLLSVGKLKPVYYAFFDSDVDYDTNYQGDPPGAGNTPGPDENQKDTEDRIKETPRLKAIHSVDPVEKSVNQVADTPSVMQTQVFSGVPGDPNSQLLGISEAAGVNQGFEGTPSQLGAGISGGKVILPPDEVVPPKVSDFLSQTYGDVPYKYPVPKKQNTAGLEIPLGTSAYNSIYYPAFDLNLSKGKIKDSIYHDSGSFGIKRIPQLEVEVTFETTIGELGEKGKTVPTSEILSVKDSDEAVDFDYSFIAEDGTYVKIEEDYISIDLRELHSLNEKENFIIEVYEVENPDTDDEILHPLKFGGQFFSDLYSEFLYDKTSNLLKVSENYVEHFFKVSLDTEIQTPTEQLGEVAQLPENNFDLCEDENEV